MLADGLYIPLEAINFLIISSAAQLMQALYASWANGGENLDAVLDLRGISEVEDSQWNRICTSSKLAVETE